jgi:hypothetical protein
MASDTESQNVSMNVTDSNVTDSNVTDSNVSNEVVESTDVNVNINLLNNIKSILEISTARGTYKATELTAVGKVYDELVVLLQ